MTSACLRTFFATALCGAVIPASLPCQIDTTRVWISGVVVDPLRRPIEGAEIRIVASNTGTFSGSDGSFRLSANRSANVLLQVRRPGFQAQLLELHESWDGTVMLQPGTYQ